MAPATDFLRSERFREGGDLALRWSGHISLTRRILAVNIFALLLLAGGFFYLDSYRARIVDSRTDQARREVTLIAEAITGTPVAGRAALVARLARDTGTRVRLFAPAGTTLLDSERLGVANFSLLDPTKQGRSQAFGRFLDASIERIAGARRTPPYNERTSARDWPTIARAFGPGRSAASVWRAPDRSPVIVAAARLDDGSTQADGLIATTAINDREIVYRIRAERFRLGMVLLTVTLISSLLSLFLARTIVRPLRRLARAAVRVRLGRAREVVVPRLPDRRDEIGSLARALSDMSLALRARIDATEAFAADVTHELKNPLASLRSAVEGIATVRDAGLQAELFAIVRDDVHRLDRLITDISEASRLDAQLSRAAFEPIDLDALLQGLIAQRLARGVERGVRMRYDAGAARAAIVAGEGARLERVFDNLLDNALSFSPAGGLITVAMRDHDGGVEVWVEDEGPGVHPDEREAVFRRFQSIRPSDEAFGQHSGLGLAIARTIVDGHGGAISVEDREDRLSGARFVVRLPMARGA